MEIEIKEIKNKHIWEDFFLACREKTFLQSWNWGKFNQNMGRKIWHFGLYDKNRLVSTALVIKIKAKRGTFLLIQHGPSIIEDKFLNKKDILQALLNNLKEIGRKEKCSFIRISFLWQKNEENQKIINELGFRQAPMHANAYESTWKLDISPAEEKLLNNMRKSTRYLIRRALKNNDLQVLLSRSTEDIKLYDKFNKEVARYQKFVPFSRQFVKNEFESFLEDDQILLLFARYKDKLVSSALIIFWSNIAFYHQAALSPSCRKLPAAYLVQWQAIKEAKKRNCFLYDFWGYIDPEKDPDHPWAGPSLFKTGFGGQAYYYLKTQDFPLSKKYYFNFIIEKIRKAKRRL